MKCQNWMLMAAVVCFAGCGDTEVVEDEQLTSALGGTPTTPSQYVTEAEPADALAVGEARSSVQDAESITIVGRIGGSSEPFVDGLAAFTIVDLKVPYCADDEGCPTPWDYCCTQDQVKDNIATIKVVDESGSPVADDARSLLGVSELSTVVVQGTARRDDQGNLTVSTSQIFVRPGS